MMSGMSDTDTARPGYAPQKAQLLKRLNRIEGQVRGISKMVGEDRYCIDVLQQISAIKAAMDKVALGLVDDHVAHCMAIGSDDEQREAMTAELMSALTRLIRS